MIHETRSDGRGVASRLDGPRRWTCHLNDRPRLGGLVSLLSLAMRITSDFGVAAGAPAAAALDMIIGFCPVFYLCPLSSIFLAPARGMVAWRLDRPTDKRTDRRTNRWANLCCGYHRHQSGASAMIHPVTICRLVYTRAPAATGNTTQFHLAASTRTGVGLLVVVCLGHLVFAGCTVSTSSNNGLV